MDEKQFKLLIDKLNEMKYILTQIQGSTGNANRQRADVVRELKRPKDYEIEGESY